MNDFFYGPTKMNGMDLKDTTLTMSEQAYRALSKAIVSLTLMPGTVVSEQALANQMGFGRTPVREALQRLIQEGLVVSYSGRNLIIAEISQKAQLHLLDVRRELDRLVARRAAERATEQEQQEFAQIADDMRESVKIPDYDFFMRLDNRFNCLILDAARNEYLARSINSMNGLWSRFWNRYYREVGDVPLVASLHAEIAEAIAAKDPARASKASDGLIDYIEEFTKRTLLA